MPDNSSIKLILGRRRVKIRPCPYIIRRALIKAFSVNITYWSQEDGEMKERFVTLWSKRTRSLPMGCFANAISCIRGLSGTIDLVDLRELPRPTVLPADVRLLQAEHRPFQRLAWERGAEIGCGVVWVGTAGGKTEVGAGFAQMWGRLPVLYLVHRRDLLVQCAERLEMRLGEPIGRYGGGAAERGLERRIVVATVQTMLRGIKAKGPKTLKLLDREGLLLLDEVHHMPSSAWARVARRSRAPLHFGLTGTAKTGDPLRDLKLIAYVGPLLVKETMGSLVRQGYAVPGLVKFWRCAYPGGWLDQWVVARRLGLIEGKARNKLIVRLARRAHGKGQACLVLTNWVAHGLKLRELFKRRGMDVPLVTGPSKDYERQRVLKSLREEGGLAIATTVWTEGIDAPELRVLILGGGGKALVGWNQSIGRALRPAPGKRRAIVHDFLDYGNTVLQRHSDARLAMAEDLAKNGGGSVRVKDTF